MRRMTALIVILILLATAPAGAAAAETASSAKRQTTAAAETLSRKQGQDYDFSGLVTAGPGRVSKKDGGVLTYERAAALMRLNNVTLKRLKRAGADMLRQYDSAVLQAGNIDTDGVSINIGGKDYYIHYGPETRLAMTRMKELLPAQMELAWQRASDTYTITENSLKTALRGVFFGLYSAQSDLRLKQKQFGLAEQENRQDRIRLANGMISGLDMQESDYRLLKAQKSVDAAERIFENAVRSFNQFAGLPADTWFSEIAYEEELMRHDLKPVNYYMEKALAERSDISGVRRQLALKEREKALIESSYIYKVSTSAQDEYEQLLYDIEQLRLDLEGTVLSVTDEITGAYADVISTAKSLDVTRSMLELQQKSHNTLLARYGAGQISGNAAVRSEIALLQAENGCNMARYNYNTKIMRFYNAVGIGPKY